jgi:hypothetical protein
MEALSAGCSSNSSETLAACSDVLALDAELADAVAELADCCE